MANRFGRARLGCVGGLVLAAALLGAQWAFDAFVGAPWAHSIGGRPTLTGDWAGELDGPGGSGGLLALEIIRGSGSKRRGVRQMYDFMPLNHQPALHGTAVWCRSDGSASQYKVWGFATSAGDVTIVFNTTVAPTRTGEELHEARGHWSGRLLTLGASRQLYTVVPGHSTTTRPLPDSTRMTMHPSSAAPGAASCAPAGAAP